ncbi:MAG: TetR/AcrR family transcriptional regulator C-terminal domain-containing protein [Eubacteriales bacterium]|nr:TetR/AcrR family transcriptional regulator C-terminal domain-containing protein [Eubacteriales bacterium]
MPDSNITKRALAEAMKELMAESPMSKITIGDIVDICAMNRKSFYYHFKDKYDLVNWIYYTEFVEDVIKNPTETSEELLQRICDFFYENKSFYINALQVTGQNSFSEYFNEIMQKIILIRIENMIAKGENKEFYANFFADAICVSITKWLLNGAEITPQKFVNLIKSAMAEIAIEIT